MFKKQILLILSKKSYFQYSLDAEMSLEEEKKTRDSRIEMSK